MAPRKHPTIAPAPAPRAPAESLFRGGPKPGTLARRVWLEEQAGLIAESIKEQVKSEDLTPAVQSSLLLTVIVGELADLRRTR